MDKMGLGTANLIGNSLGARIAMECVAIAPERMPLAKSVVIDHCGHVPMIEHADEFATIAMAFVKE
jgi:pimeloyl-ACP methyl ester carboxylesterase